MLLCVKSTNEASYFGTNGTVLAQYITPDLWRNMLTYKYSTTQHAGAMLCLLNSYKTVLEGL